MHPFLRQILGDIRIMPRGVWVLVGGQFINRFGSFVYPFLALFMIGRGMRLGEISAVLGSMALGQLGAPFAGGYLADAIGRRNTIVIALVGGALSLLGLYACAHPLTLCGMAAAHGFFAFMFGPAANALLSDLVTPRQRVTAYALLRLAVNAGFASGPAIAGLLFGVAPILIFLGDAATTLVFAVLALLFLPHGLRPLGGNVTSPWVIARSWREAGRDAWHNGPFVQLYLGTLLMAVAFVQVFNVLALHAAARGLDTVAYGLAMGFNGLLIMGIELPLAHATRRLPARRVLAVGFAVIGCGCAAFALAHTLPQFLAAMGLFTLGEMISLPVSSGYASELSPVAYRGRYFGIIGTVWGVAGLAGSAGPWMYGRLGAGWWLLAGAGGLIGGFCMLPRVLDRRIAAVPAPAAGAGR